MPGLSGTGAFTVGRADPRRLLTVTGALGDSIGHPRHVALQPGALVAGGRRATQRPADLPGSGGPLLDGGAVLRHPVAAALRDPAGHQIAGTRPRPSSLDRSAAHVECVGE